MDRFLNIPALSVLYNSKTVFIVGGYLFQDGKYDRAVNPAEVIALVTMNAQRSIILMRNIPDVKIPGSRTNGNLRMDFYPITDSMLLRDYIKLVEQMNNFLSN